GEITKKDFLGTIFESNAQLVADLDVAIERNLRLNFLKSVEGVVGLIRKNSPGGEGCVEAVDVLGVVENRRVGRQEKRLAAARIENDGEARDIDARFVDVGKLHRVVVSSEFARMLLIAGRLRDLSRDILNQFVRVDQAVFVFVGGAGHSFDDVVT